MKRKLITAVVIITTQTGCAATVLNNDEFRLSGTPEGIQAFSDWQTGTITETKNHPEQKSSYWQHREKALSVKALKFKKVTK